MKLTILCTTTLALLTLPASQGFQTTPGSRSIELGSSQQPNVGLSSRRSSFQNVHNDRQKKSWSQLEASPLTALASSPLGAISVLAGIVVVHEAGHYLAARGFNISVDEFSVGFGPKLAGFKALGNEFNLRAFPLGGFVRFPENYDIAAAEEKSQLALEAFEKRRKEEGWTAKEDILNAATFGLWDERRRTQRKTALAAEAAQELEQRPWWRKLGGGKKKNTFQSEDPEDFEIQYYDDPNLLQNRPWFERAVVLSGGVVFNLILAYLIYFGQIGPLGNGLPQPVFADGVVVSQAPTRNGPSDGMLNKGDVIVGINGNIVSMSKTSGAAAAQKQVSDIISRIKDTNDGEAVTLSVIREGKTTPQNLEITPKRNGQASQQAIGVFLSANFVKTEKIQSDDILEASKLAYRYLSNTFSQTVGGFASIFSTFLSGKGGGQSLSGPVGLIKTGTEIVSTQDITTVLLFAAALSVNLGVVNALPLPALDGGQLLFVLAEAVTGRKIDQRLQEGLTSAAVLFLLFVTLSTTFSDVTGIIARR